MNPKRAFTRITSLLRTSLACTLLSAFTATAQAPGDLRVALVIGNAAYAGTAALVNPANDARDMTSTLRSLGFTVVELRDGSKSQIDEAIVKVRDTLKGKQGIGMLYYAGHGMQLDWHNFMVPVDAKLAQSADVAAQTVDVNTVLDAFKVAGNRMNILVLDACRDNPFGKNGTASGKGLAQQDAPPGTFLAYATAPGNVAEDSDGKGDNGLYTQYLLQELKKPVSRIEDVFKRVRFNVRQKSGGRQIPWESTSLEDDFFFNDGKVRAVEKPIESERDKAFALEKADWDTVKSSQRVDDFYAFLQKYPNGNIAEVVQAKIELLAAAQIETQPDQSGMTQSPGARRFRQGDTYELVFKDGYTGAVKFKSTARVTKVTDDIAEYTGQFGANTRGLSTVAGAVLADNGGQYDPPYPLIPGGDYVVGKHWAGHTSAISGQGRKFTLDFDAKVVAKEKITVEAGTFETYKLEFNFIPSTGSRYKTTSWVLPDWGLAVKMKVEIKDGVTPTVIVREWAAYKRGQG